MRFILKSANSKEFYEYKLEESQVDLQDLIKNSSDAKHFIFHPFDNQKNAVITAKVVGEKKLTLPFLSQSLKIDFQDSIKKSDYLIKVNQVIDAINSGALQKLVFSRETVLELGYQPNWIALLNTLYSKYPNAAIYLFKYQEIIWIGATPEELLACKKGDFTIASLAGTIAKSERKSRNWTPKEVVEQQIVTDEIAQNLKKLNLKFEISEIFEINTGNLFHLKSEIKGSLNSPNQVLDLIKVLHPTPAVCGKPQKEAFDYIKKHEGYNREYYTGFFGFINLKNLDSELYVNLRCLKAEEKKVTIYAGGGIISTSDPQIEWEETEHKTNTLKSVFE